MQWLTAILAFATTMLIFAIIVSTLVEIIHRTFKLRGNGMQLMLENLYVHVIEPYLGDQQPRLEPSKFAEIIMKNRAIGECNADQRGRISTFLHWLVDSSSMTDIPVEVFTQKLADNKIVGAADNFTDEVLQDIAQKYEAFGDEISTYFSRRARIFSVGVAFLVAWMFYVHPYNIAVTYIKSPQIAQSMADKAADAHGDYRALIERLENLTSDGNVSGEDATALKAAIAKLSDNVEVAQTTTKELAELGVPVGWPESDANVAACSEYRS